MQLRIIIYALISISFYSCKKQISTFENPDLLIWNNKVNNLTKSETTYIENCIDSIINNKLIKIPNKDFYSKSKIHNKKLNVLTNLNVHFKKSSRLSKLNNIKWYQYIAIGGMYLFGSLLLILASSCLLFLLLGYSFKIKVYVALLILLLIFALFFGLYYIENIIHWFNGNN